MFLLFFWGFHGAAQDLSNRGKDFWVAYAGHIDGTKSRMALYITSDQNASGQVAINGNTIPFSVTANQVTTVQLTSTSNPSNALAYNGQVEGIGVQKGIHITADQPVAVYAHILNAARSGATLVLPTNVLGKEYYVASYKSATAGSDKRSQFEVVATMDNTTVQITPTQADGNGNHSANTPFLITLSKGDVYQYQSDEDLTGTYIKSIGTSGTSCQPIAVFSGSTFASMGCPSPGSGDNLYQQLFPFGAWGKVYYTAPFVSRSYDIFRILVQDPAEPVYVNGTALNPSTLVAGRFYEINTQGNNTPRIITCAKPVCVLQYLITQSCDGVKSDPEMVILNPVEQTLKDITVMSARNDLTPPSTNITSHYLNIIFKTNTLNSLRIDGAPPTAPPQVIAGTGYSYIQQDVTASTQNNPAHRITSDSGFICIAYGYGQVESYGYNAGANVKDLYQFVSVQNQYASVDFPATCKGSPFYFNMTFPYQPTQLQWIFGPSLNATGLKDTTINTPAYDSTWIINGKQLFRYKLPHPYTISKTGNFPIKLLAQNPTPEGCSGEQEINYVLQVYDPPVAGFNLTTTGCAKDPVSFTDASTTQGRPVYQWYWNFADGSTSAAQNPSHNYSVAGSYDVRFAVITDIGCVSDTGQRRIEVAAQPVARFGVSAPLCINRPITFTDSSTSASSPITRWTWDFGDGSAPVAATSNAAQTHTYTTGGSYTVKLIVETATGCRGLEFSRQLTVYRPPLASFVFGNACLPTGTMQFTNTTVAGTDPGSGIAGCNWTFSDGGSSSLCNPVHSFSSIGPFTATLLVTSDAGCAHDTTMIINTVYAQPEAGFTVNQKQACLDKVFHFNDTSSAAGSTLTEWYWDFGDGSSSTQKSPVKTYAAPGTYLVQMYVRSAAGCTSNTATETITVHALPTARFSITSTACETRDISFADQSLANEGTITQWRWNMGAGAPDTVRTSGAPFTYVYPSAGTFPVKLQVTTDLGCVSNLLDTTITVHPQPVAGFAMSANCLADPYSEFTDTSKIASGTITGWSWNFGDPQATPSNPNTSGQPHPKHKYSQAITYNVSLTATSDQGCFSSISQPFTINGSVPQSNFTVQGALCSNDSVRIINHSFADVGKIVKLEIYWDYANDPTRKTTDRSPAPGKQYTFKYPEFFTPATKAYTIKVVAYSGDICLKDSTVTIQVKNTPDIAFNPLAAVCGNEPSFPLPPASVLNNAGGNGIYTGQGTTANGQFNPAGAAPGIHSIRYTHTGANGCTNFKETTIEVHPVPSVSAGADKTILEGGSDTLSGSGTGRNITYLWSPGQWLSNVTVARPQTSALEDTRYVLTVRSSDGCSASDEVWVKVLKAPTVPNVFTPNGDGINETWSIKYLDTYPGATVEIYNRYGQLVFQSKGYPKPWDGTYNGRPVPGGTYYYIINPKNGRKQMAGFVDVLR